MQFYLDVIDSTVDRNFGDLGSIPIARVAVTSVVTSVTLTYVYSAFKSYFYESSHVFKLIDKP